MSPDRAALLAAVRAAPDDDLPRLVFADWLDEHGEPAFAEFIRLGVEKARLAANDPRHRTLGERWNDLAAGDPARFLGLPFPAVCHRGFVHTIHTTARQYLDWADRLGPYAPRLDVILSWDEIPWVPDAPGVDPPPNDGTDHLAAFQALSGCPWLATWGTLIFWGNGQLPTEPRRLVESPHLGNLRRLRVPGHQFDDLLDRVMADPARLPGLTVLDLPGARPSRAAVRALAGSPLLGRLAELDLSGSDLGDDGLRQLGAAPRTAGLRVLNVAYVDATAAGVEALIASPHLAGLRALTVSGPVLDWLTLLRLADPSVLPGLKELTATPGRRSGGQPSFPHALAERFGPGLRPGGEPDDGIPF